MKKFLSLTLATFVCLGISPSASAAHGTRRGYPIRPHLSINPRRTIRRSAPSEQTPASTIPSTQQQGWVPWLCSFLPNSRVEDTQVNANTDSEQSQLPSAATIAAQANRRRHTARRKTAQETPAPAESATQNSGWFDRPINSIARTLERSVVNTLTSPAVAQAVQGIAKQAVNHALNNPAIAQGAQALTDKLADNVINKVKTAITDPSLLPAIVQSAKAHVDSPEGRAGIATFASGIHDVILGITPEKREDMAKAEQAAKEKDAQLSSTSRSLMVAVGFAIGAFVLGSFSWIKSFFTPSSDLLPNITPAAATKSAETVEDSY